MSYSLPLVGRGTGAPYSFFEKFLSDEDCLKLIALAESMPIVQAYVGGGNDGVVDLKRRKSDVRWLQWSPDHEWIFNRLAVNIATTNEKWFGFKLAGMLEALQLTHYAAQEPKEGEEVIHGHYTWHEDSGDTGPMSMRKLSFIIPLNDGYEGGRFRLLHHDVPEQGKGNMICFPSFKTHCVEPVTKGERWSLVGWVTGPPFV